MNFVDPTGLQEVIVGPCPAGQCVVTVYGSVGGLFGGGGGGLGSTLHPPLLDGPLLMEVVAAEAARWLRFKILLRSHIRCHQSNRSRRSSMTV